MSFVNDNGVIRILNPTEFKEKLGLSSNARRILRDAIPNYDSVILKYKSKYENPYDKVRRLCPKLARIEDGNRFYFFLQHYKNKEPEMIYGVSTGKDGYDCPIAKISDLLSDDFKPEDLSPGQLIDKYLG